MTMEYDPTLYEADPRSFLKEEVDFYKKIIDRFSSKTILELGVGTGRIFSKLLPRLKTQSIKSRTPEHMTKSK